VYLIQFLSTLKFEKTDFWIRILQYSNPLDLIFRYTHPYSQLIITDGSQWDRWRPKLLRLRMIDTNTQRKGRQVCKCNGWATIEIPRSTRFTLLLLLHHHILEALSGCTLKACDAMRRNKTLNVASLQDQPNIASKNQSISVNATAYSDVLSRFCRFFHPGVQVESCPAGYFRELASSDDIHDAVNNHLSSQKTRLGQTSCQLYLTRSTTDATLHNGLQWTENTFCTCAWTARLLRQTDAQRRCKTSRTRLAAEQEAGLWPGLKALWGK